MRDETTPSVLAYHADLPVRTGPEVLVVGAGPAGLAAAIAAARNGARTLLIERYGFLGGNLTAGLVGPCMTAYSLDGKQQLIKGIFDDFVRRMERTGGALHPSTIPAGSPYSGFIVYGHDKVTPFNPEAVKFTALEMCQEAGVELQLHTLVLDSLVEDGVATGVVAASKSGLEAHKAAITIDCSADGDVAARAGAPFEVGREADGLTQPMTLFFRVANVDDATVEEYIRDHPEDIRAFASLVAQARERGDFPIPRRGVGIYKTLEPGVWRVNTTRMHSLDGTDVRDLTQGEILGRQQVVALMAFFRKCLPGFQQCELLDTAMTIGVRETRRILGDYLLTLDDLTTGRAFEDVVALAGYPVDIHSPTGDGGSMTPEERVGLETANAYQIPYRSLVPRGVEQLLVAGRCISATHEALGAIRVMPPAFAMGQAAGTAAALAIELGVSPRAVPIPQVQDILVRQGAYLGERFSAGVGT